MTRMGTDIRRQRGSFEGFNIWFFIREISARLGARSEAFLTLTRSEASERTWNGSERVRGEGTIRIFYGGAQKYRLNKINIP